MKAHIGGTEETGNPMKNSRLNSIEKCSYRETQHLVPYNRTKKSRDSPMLALDENHQTNI